jgi:thiopeptide-type bacteriocin biosynthesis protein
VWRDNTLPPHRPETRHGAGPTLAAAEAVFAADSRAALQRLSGDRQAATAAGMIAIAGAFTGDGLRWLSERAPHRGGPRLEATQLAVARGPYGDDDLLTALAAYRSLADRDGLDVDQVLADLLHLHHARMIGVDTASERHCLRLARAVARADIVRRTP